MGYRLQGFSSREITSILEKIFSSREITTILNKISAITSKIHSITMPCFLKGSQLAKINLDFLELRIYPFLKVYLKLTWQKGFSLKFLCFLTVETLYFTFYHLFFFCKIISLTLIYMTLWILFLLEQLDIQFFLSKSLVFMSIICIFLNKC